MSKVSVVNCPSDADGDSNAINDEELFTFSNGDVYNGGFKLVKDQQFVTRQGHGLYLTEDFNEYKAYWSEDQILGEACICYNNGTRYKGTLGDDGGMVGSGVYTFANNSILRATWRRNTPAANITMKEPLTSSIWEGASSRKVTYL